MNNKAEKRGEGLPSPRVVLYPADKIALQWKKIHKVGSGLENKSVTCYVNATLQVLCYTPPLVNFCYTQDHFLECKNTDGSCLMCEFIRHAREHFKTTKDFLAPSGIFARVAQETVSTLNLFTNGQQEDAHEFLRYMIDGMQRSCLNGYNKLDRYSKGTTVINQIYGGFLRSQVLCTRCKNRSNTYDPFMDLSLDLRNNTSVDKCLDKFFMSEYLEGDNAYMCTVCQQKVRAQKRFTIEKAPNVLTLHLKRFDFARMCKITKYIDFEQKMDIRPYMSFRQGEPVLYDLHSIIVHCGANMNGGHYFSYNKVPNMMWYKMNDEVVQEVSAQKVLRCEAYVLVYCKTELNYQSIPMAKAAYMGPMKPLSMFPNGNNNHKKANGIPTNELGTAIVRKTSTKSLFSPDKPLFTPDKITKSASTSSILPPTQDKVSFGIKPNSHKDPNNDTDSEISRSSGSRKRKKEKDADDDKESKLASTAINNIIMNGHLDGWTVTPSGSCTSICSVTSDFKDIHPTDGLERNIYGVFSESCLLGSKTDSSPLKKSHSEISMPSAKLPITELYHFEKTKDITINDITNPAYDKDCESSFKVNSKKENCDSYKLDDFYYNMKDESSSSSDVQQKKLKKKEHQKHDRDDSDTEQNINKLKRKYEEGHGDIDNKKSKINGEEDCEWVEQKVDSKPVKKVLSWDGNKSKLNEECDKERVRVKRKMDKDDSYDEECDRRKVKKVKTKQEDDKSFGFNPFQKLQDYRNKKTNGSGSSHSSPSSKEFWKCSYRFHGKHSYSRNPHNGNHHYNHHHNHHQSDNNYRHDNQHYSKHRYYNFIIHFKIFCNF